MTPGQVFTLLCHLHLASPCEALVWVGQELNHDWSLGSVPEGSVWSAPITALLGAESGDQGLAGPELGACKAATDQVLL